MLSFTTPAADLGDAADQSAASAFTMFGSVDNWPAKPKVLAGLPITARYWSWPRWKATSSTPTIRVWRNPDVWDEPARWSTVPAFLSDTTPALIPWASTWRTGVGTDQGVMIVMANGDEWHALNLRQANVLNALPLAFRSRFRARSGDWICDSLQRCTPANVGTFEGRGMGRVPKSAGMLLAEDVANGQVRTALSVVGFNVQYGPGARFVAPATRVEHLSSASRGTPALVLPQGNDARMVPQGTRLRLDMTGDEISAWAGRTHVDPIRRSTARIVANGLRNYGMIVGAETGNGQPQIESEGTLNPETARVWAMLGMTSDAHFAGLLAGLFTSTNLKVVNAA